MAYPSYKKTTCTVVRYGEPDAYHNVRVISSTLVKCKFTEEIGELKLANNYITYNAKMIVDKYVNILTGDVINGLYKVIKVIKQYGVAQTVIQQLIFME